MEMRTVPRRTTTIVLVVVLAGLLAGDLAAHGVPDLIHAGDAGEQRAAGGQRGKRAQAGAGDAPDETAAVTTGELVSMLDTYAIVEAQRALALGDDKYGQFVSRLKRLQEARRRNQRERTQMVQGLRRLVGPQAASPVDETAVRERLRDLRDHDERAAAEIRTAYDALDEVLDVRQQARFRVFEETIERRKLDLLVRARERAARPRLR